MLNERQPIVLIVSDNNLNNNCNKDFQRRICALAYSNLGKCFYQKFSQSNINPGDRHGDRNTPPLDRHLSAPNKLLIKRQAIAKMNLNLSLISYVFRES